MFHWNVQGFLGPIFSSETFSRVPEHYQPAIICGSGVSEGYIGLKKPFRENANPNPRLNYFFRMIANATNPHPIMKLDPPIGAISPTLSGTAPSFSR